MQIEAGPFIAGLRNRLASKLTNDEEKAILSAFDRACVEVLTGSSNTATPKPAEASKGKAEAEAVAAKKALMSKKMKAAWKKRKAKEAAVKEAEGQEGEGEEEEGGGFDYGEEEGAEAV